MLLYLWTVACDRPAAVHSNAAEAAASVELREVVEPFSGEVHPLMLWVDVESAASVDVEVTASSALSGHTVSTASSESANAHQLLLAGLRAGQSYEVKVRWHSPDASHRGETILSHDSGELPSDLPTVTLISRESEQMQPGITVFTTLRIPKNRATTVAPPGYMQGLALGVDEDGEIVWYARHPYPMGDLRQTASGAFIATVDETSAREFNVAGRTLREWTGRFDTRIGLSGYALGSNNVEDQPKVGEDALRMDVDMMHHEIKLTEDDQLLFLSSELQVLNFDEPQCAGRHGEPREFDGTYGLIGDVVVWADPDTGEVLQEFSLLDALEPEVNTSLFHTCPKGSFLNGLYWPEYQHGIDWSHGNGIELDEDRNLVWVSASYIYSVLGLRLEDDAHGAAGELVHKLSPVDPTLKLVGDGQWHFAQHAPELQPNGNLLIYDNGNGRTSGVKGASDYSRVVEYDIDLQTGTIKQVWEYVSQHDGAAAFHPVAGDADRLDNGNVLITDGSSGESHNLNARITEVSPEPVSGGSEVWSIEIEDQPGIAVWVYRSERIDSLTP